MQLLIVIYFKFCRKNIDKNKAKENLEFIQNRLKNFNNKKLIKTIILSIPKKHNKPFNYT